MYNVLIPDRQSIVNYFFRIFLHFSKIIAVDDNIGTISIYRIVEDVTIIHEGPLQQLQRLKAVLTINLDLIQLEV